MATQTAPKPAAAQAPKPPAAKRVRKAPPVDPNESRSARFTRLARKRLFSVLKGMKGLEKLGRGSGYEYTPEQAAKIMQYLTDGVAAVKISMAPRVRGSRAAQELPDL